MGRKTVAKVTDKLTKTSDTVNVYFYDNGYMCEVSGRDAKDEYASVKLTCKDLAEVLKFLEDVDSLPRE